MIGCFRLAKLSELNLADPFFDSLKADYPNFPIWFQSKANAGRTALVYLDEIGIGAFVCLKEESEEIVLRDRVLPSVARMKISTFKLAERYHGQRIGEGALGLALWKWQQTGRAEIYVTVYNKHTTLIGLLERFGFILSGYNASGECVYLKSRFDVDYSSAFQAFPYINPSFQYAGYLVVNDHYHDTLFPYSELSNTVQNQLAASAANGLTKVYIGTPQQVPPYRIGDPILIYRKHTQPDGQKPAYKSCVTSYCVVTDICVVKENNKPTMSLQQFAARVSNKSVFTPESIRELYGKNRNLVVIEMLYYGFFGAGNNVNWMWLKQHGFWPDGYPTSARLTQEQFKAILKEASVNVQDVIIDPSAACGEDHRRNEAVRI